MMIKIMRMSTEIGKGSINHATAADVTADTCSIGNLKKIQTGRIQNQMIIYPTEVNLSIVNIYNHGH